MEDGSYTFLQQGFRFVVLDGNDRHEGTPGGYPRHVGAEQRAWLMPWSLRKGLAALIQGRAQAAGQDDQ